MRIGLLGQFGSGNSGNDGSLEAMVRFLRRAHPDVELVCICSRPDVVSRELGVDAISVTARSPESSAFAWMNSSLLGMPQRFLNMTEAFRRTRALDWIIVPGTGILDDFRENPFGWPFMLWRWCLAARVNGARIAFVSIGAGPISHPLSRRFMLSAARMASYRSYRDRISLDYMAGIGLDTSPDSVFPDIAFGLPVPEQAPMPARRNLTVGIGIMSYRGWSKKESGEDIYRGYLMRLAELALQLLQEDYHLRLLTGDKGDAPAVQDFLRLLTTLSPRNFHTSITVEPCVTLSDLMRQMQDTDVVVASRYHNIVCALKLGIPAISLSYARKNDAVMSEFGLGEFCHHIESFEVAVLVDQLRDLIARQEWFRARLGKRSIGFGMELSEQEALISNLLFGGSPQAVLSPIAYPS